MYYVLPNILLETAVLISSFMSGLVNLRKAIVEDTILLLLVFIMTIIITNATREP